MTVRRQKKAYLQGEMDDDHQDLSSNSNSHSDWGDHFEEFPKFGIMLCISSTPCPSPSSQGEKMTYQARNEKDIKFE